MNQTKRTTKTFDNSTPRSLCSCGHTGDGEGSEHKDMFSFGHGPCAKCPCPQFTWVGWLEAEREAQ